MQKTIIIPIITLLVGAFVSFAVFSFLEKGKETHREIEMQQRIKTAGDDGDKIGRLLLLVAISKEFKENGEIKFAPLLFDEEGNLQLEGENQVPVRGKERVLIQKTEIEKIAP